MSRQQRGDAMDHFLGVDDEVLTSLLSGVMQFEPEHAAVDTPGVEAELPQALELMVEIGVLRLTVGELCRVAVGDVLPLSLHPNDEVRAVLDGTPLLSGRIILCGESVAVQINAVQINAEIDPPE